MIITDALSILGVSGDYTPEIIKQAYRRACAKYHPDRNASGLEMMKMVNLAYEVLKDESGKTNENDLASYGEAISNALNAIIHLGLDIEICGSWVWLHGDTKPHKDTIKQAGFRWASKKSLWYYRPDNYKSRARGKFSMNEIREKHGSEKVTMKERTRLAA